MIAKQFNDKFYESLKPDLTSNYFLKSVRNSTSSNELLPKLHRSYSTDIISLKNVMDVPKFDSMTTFQPIFGAKYYTCPQSIFHGLVGSIYNFLNGYHKSVNFSCDVNKFHWMVDTSHNSWCCQIHIYLFSNTQTGNLILKFQRVNGYASLFNSFCEDFINETECRESISNYNPSTKMTQPLPPKRLNQMQICNVHSNNSIKDQPLSTTEFELLCCLLISWLQSDAIEALEVIQTSWPKLWSDYSYYYNQSAPYTGSDEDVMRMQNLLIQLYNVICSIVVHCTNILRGEESIPPLEIQTISDKGSPPNDWIMVRSCDEISQDKSCQNCPMDKENEEDYFLSEAPRDSFRLLTSRSMPNIRVEEDFDLDHHQPMNPKYTENLTHRSHHDVSRILLLSVSCLAYPSVPVPDDLIPSDPMKNEFSLNVFQFVGEILRADKVFMYVLLNSLPSKLAACKLKQCSLKSHAIVSPRNKMFDVMSPSHGSIKNCTDDMLFQKSISHYVDRIIIMALTE